MRRAIINFKSDNKNNDRILLFEDENLPCTTFSYGCKDCKIYQCVRSTEKLIGCEGRTVRVCMKALRFID
jgi:hypothetical protein